MTVALPVVDGRQRAVNGNFVEVGPAQALELRVGIGKQAALQQGVVAEIDARHHVAEVEGHLFSYTDTQLKRLVWPLLIVWRI